MVGRAEEGGEKAGKYTAGIYNNTHVHITANIHIIIHLSPTRINTLYMYM